MKKKYFAILVLLLVAVCTDAQERYSRHVFRLGKDVREYVMHIPEGLPDDAPLVLVLHGYGGNADKILEKGFTECADRHGFAVCYPDGSPDTKGKLGWNVGYPSQEPCGTDDAGYVCALARHVQKKFGLSRENTFLTGMSNGGDICYTIALERPGHFTAYAPIAGLTLEKVYKTRTAEVPAPFFEIHGTADRTSRWEGDPANDGGWGKYISVPLAVQLWAVTAKCTHEITEELPLKDGGHKVLAHRYVGGVPAWKDGPQTQVWLYEVCGGKHSWHLDSVDTCGEIWRFFSLYLR